MTDLLKSFWRNYQMTKSNPIDKFKYDFMKETNSKQIDEKYSFQLDKLPDLKKAEIELRKVIQNFELAKHQLEFKFEELTEFGQIVRSKNKIIFFIAPEKHELIYNLMCYDSTVSDDIYKVFHDSVSTLLSIKHKK